VYYIALEEPPEEINFFKFPGGEPHVNVPTLEGDVFIDARGLRNWDNFLNLLVLLNALSYQEKVRLIFTYMPYFPGARQDRNPGGNTPHTVQLVAAMLKAATRDDRYHFKFYTFDMHSVQGHFTAVHDINLTNLTLHDLDSTEFDSDIDGIICPDEGAIDRAVKFQKAHFPDATIAYCTKVRDFETGKILSYEINNFDTSRRKWLVVDDICDGGATFNLLAKAFSEISDAELQLYISHGIFSKGILAISAHFAKIYTTPSLTRVFDQSAAYASGRVQYVTLPQPKVEEYV
jgi:ribose-phosphate pyrophosphokinase